MSTPTTATATLPPYSHHPYAYTRQQYRPPPARLAPKGYTTSTSSSSSQNTQHQQYAAPVSNGINHAVSVSSTSSSTRPTYQDPASLTPSSVTSTHTMPAAQRQSQALQAAPSDTMPPTKRRRPDGRPAPDWSTFYKNGLPKEIIVIDDTPEPPNMASAAQPVSVPSGSSSQGSARQAAKKRKRDDDVARYDPVHHSILGSVPDHTPSGSTNSSDRTYSTLHTSAPTSLGSASSNGHYEYAVQPGQKRKRVTRQQLANEAKQREALLGQPCTYQPPPRPPKKVSEVDVRFEADYQYQSHVRVDDDDGHYIVVPDAELTDRYKMVKLLGQGTFGKVVQAHDKKKGDLVAIKIIRSVQKYRDASRIELRVLQTLKANDAQNRNRCIHLRDCFDYRGHICIVTDLLGQSVFDFLKGNNFVPFPNSQIQSFARQLFSSVAFLHDLNLIHTDLKPENILLWDANYQTFTYNRKIPSSSTTVSRQATQRRVLLDSEIRLIDFGSATFQDEYHSSVVSTRHYRAPEIILGLGWSFPCDIWSIGCILVEFYTGDALFQTHDNLEHLAMMEVVCDSRIDTHLVQQIMRMTRNGGNPMAKHFRRTKLDYPTPETTRASRRFVKAMKKLADIVPGTSPYNKNLLDLLKKIFVYDPAHRITAKQALQHPFLTEPSTPDDGTEAAKIRLERLQRASSERTTARIPVLHA